MLDLKQRYRHFLASLRQRSVDVHRQELAYATTAAEAGKLAALFSNDSILDDKQQSNVITASEDPESEQKQARVEEALYEIGRYSRAYADILKTVVTNVFILPSSVARAGSTSQAVGVIWINPKLSYPTPDLMEMLIHEFTHQAMFLDELRFEHYSYDAIANRSTWAKSAILNARRPLDKVLHSIVVAIEILLFRHRHIGQPVMPRAHPPSRIISQQLGESLSSVEDAIRRFPGILKPRAVELVTNARNIVSHASMPSPSRRAQQVASKPKRNTEHGL